MYALTLQTPVCSVLNIWWVAINFVICSAVTPLLSGKRQVLVVELWQGEERDCPHRCVQHWGPCGFKDGCGDGDGSVEVGDADALAAALGGATAGHY
jgi:hypothetical protein